MWYSLAITMACDPLMAGMAMRHTGRSALRRSVRDLRYRSTTDCSPPLLLSRACNVSWKPSALNPTSGFAVASFSTRSEEHKRRSVAKSLHSDIQALSLLHQQLQSETTLSKHFAALLQRLERCHRERRRVFVTGIGKSAIVARRLASTLSSISVQSQWVHGSEWVHGELGNVRAGDVIIVLSHSGNTAELLGLPAIFARRSCDTIAIVGQADSSLAGDCSLALVVPASDQTTCPVPSRSIIVQEAISNAIVEYLVESIEDSDRQFQANHPGGSIGDCFAKEK